MNYYVWHSDSVGVFCQSVANIVLQVYVVFSQVVSPSHWLTKTNSDSIIFLVQSLANDYCVSSWKWVGNNFVYIKAHFNIHITIVPPVKKYWFDNRHTEWGIIKIFWQSYNWGLETLLVRKCVSDLEMEVIVPGGEDTPASLLSPVSDQELSSQGKDHSPLSSSSSEVGLV